MDFIHRLEKGTDRLTRDNMIKYEGEIHDGKINGYGRATYTEDEYYEGQWVDGVRQGEVSSAAA